jgi:calcineurin-like phosphoesterase family protein
MDTVINIIQNIKKLLKFMNYWFTSDTHFFHKNICKYANRPFANIYEMNEVLIKNWNEKIQDDDIVFFLGDFAFANGAQIKDLFFKLKGKISVIWGNHDQSLKQFLKGIKNYPELWKRIEILGDYAEITVNNQDITLCHYAMRTFNGSHRGSWQLYGHSHASLPDDPHSLSIDVGVDCNNYYPFSFEQIKEIMSKKLWQPVDHHGEK